MASSFLSRSRSRRVVKHARANSSRGTALMRLALDGVGEVMREGEDGDGARVEVVEGEGEEEGGTMQSTEPR